MTWRIRSTSFQSMLPNWSLNALMMLLSRSSSGSGLPPPPPVGTGPISASWSGSAIFNGLLDLDTVAVHVDGFENAFGQIILLRSRQLGNKEIQEDGQLLPLGIGVRQDRGQELIGPAQMPWLCP